MIRAVVAHALLLFSGLAPQAFAEAPVWRVAVDVQIVSVPTPRALRLVPKLQDPVSFAAAYSELQAMIARDEAELIGWPCGTQKFSSGVPILVHSFTGAETHYFEDYEFPRGIPSFGAYPPPGPNDPNAKDPLYPWSATPIAETSAEIGTTLGVDPTVSEDGLRIVLEMSVKWRGISGIQSFTSTPRTNGLLETEQFPRLNNANLSTRICLNNSVRALLGSAPDPRAQPALFLFLVKCTATRLAP